MARRRAPAPATDVPPSVARLETALARFDEVAMRREQPEEPDLQIGHLPNTVYGLLRDMRGRPIGVIHRPHDGTVEGIRAATGELQGRAYGSWSGINSQWIATDERGRAGWAVSPNLALVYPAGSDGAAYVLGDLSRGP